MSSAEAVIKQVSPLPCSEKKTFIQTVTSNTFVANSGVLSEQQPTRLIVKRDDNNGATHRVAFLGFDVAKYNHSGLIGRATLRLHRRSNATGNVDVFLVENSDFWQTSFNWVNRPKKSVRLASFNTADADDQGWLTIELDGGVPFSELLASGKFSLALESSEPLLYHEFSSAWVSRLQPQLVLETQEETMGSANAIHFIKIVAMGEANNQNVTCMAGIDVITSSGMVLNPNQLRVIEATSMQGAQNLFDGQATTCWKVNDALPNYCVIDLGVSTDVNAIIYTPLANVTEGRISDIRIYGSSNGTRWKPIGSRSVPVDDLNAPHIIYTGIHADLPQVEETYSLSVRPTAAAEMNRIRCQFRRAERNVTGLFFRQATRVLIWIDGVKPGDTLIAREGQWTGSVTHRLKKGMNVINVAGGDNPFYIQAMSSDVNDTGRKAQFRIMATNALYYPVFRTRQTTQRQWLEMINIYKEANFYEMVSDSFILIIDREFFKARQNQVNMQELADIYDEYIVAAHFAAGLSPNHANPLHRPDHNPYHYVRLSSGYMSATHDRLNYFGDLTRRMVTPAEVRSFWGIWHEVGHTLQTRGLNWGGQMEVSVNIYAFAVRAYNTRLSSLVERYDPLFRTSYNAIARSSSYASLDRESRENMFHHLFFIFGKYFMFDLHQRYRANLAGQVSDPEFTLGATDDQQMNVLAMMASKITQTNLVEFFRFWKFNLTAQTVATIDAYGYKRLTNFDRLPSQLVAGRPATDFDMRFDSKIPEEPEVPEEPEEPEVPEEPEEPEVPEEPEEPEVPEEPEEPEVPEVPEEPKVPEPTPSLYPLWEANRIYNGGERVSHKGRNYLARWWIGPNIEPGLESTTGAPDGDGRPWTEI